MPDVYTKAGILDPGLRDAYETCRRMVRRRTPDEYALAPLIPPVLRPAFWAMWAAGCTADDLVDHGGELRQRATALEEWTAALEADLKRGTSGDPVRRALVHTVLNWNFAPGDLYAVLHMLHQDIYDEQPATWQEWSVRRASWSVCTVNSALVLAGAVLRTPVRLRDVESCRRWLDAFLLVDSLTDLSDDLSRGHVEWPVEAFRQAGADVADLLERRWTPGVEALTEQVNARAQRWLCLGPVGLPPWLAMLFGSATEMYQARLRAARAAGPALLHRSPRLPRPTRWRILVPARAKAALVWRLTPVTAPIVMASAAPPTTADPATPALKTHPAQASLPPLPHPSGARPPVLPRERMPRHVAIIMDGNGRWATRRGLPRTEGHRAGERALRDIVHGALEIGLPHLTVYAFSTENWKRSPEEVDALMNLVRTFDRHEEDNLFDRDVRIRWAGSEQGLPTDILEALHRLEAETRHHTGLTCTLCVNYGGRDELAQAAGALARAACAGQVDPARVSERILSRYLPDPDLPDVDLLWRTGGERRTSNFLPWQTAYAELHFTDTLWPDVDRRDLWQAIAAYTRRERRYGTVPRLRLATGRPSMTTAPEPRGRSE